MNFHDDDDGDWHDDADDGHFHDAVDDGDLERLKLLLWRADKDKADGTGWTALFRSARKGYLSIVQCLVEQGADKENPA